MSDLAQRLREVAHEADVAAHNRAILGVIGKRMSRDEKRTVVSWVRSTAVAVAILRELADGLFEELLNRVEPGMVVRPNVIPDVIRGWADSIEKGGHGA